MRTPYTLNTDTRSRHALHRHYAQGGSLPHYVQGGTGFFGDLWSGVKRMAAPVLKNVAKAALPMVTQAVETALRAPKGQRLKAAAQSAATKQNLLTLGRAVARPII